jgi:hypothetical protein
MCVGLIILGRSSNYSWATFTQSFKLLLNSWKDKNGHELIKLRESWFKQEVVHNVMRFVAFPTTEYDDVFSCYQPDQWLSGEKTNVSKTISVLVLYQTSSLRARTEMVFETLVFSLLNHLTRLIIQTITLRARTEMVFETLVFSPLNLWAWLIARENFIIHNFLRFADLLRLFRIKNNFHSKRRNLSQYLLINERWNWLQ